MLEQGAHNAACAVKLLIIHALRTGAVAARSWQELKAQTLGRADKTIQWTTPDYPVISRIKTPQYSFLDLGHPASPSQPLASIGEMSLKARFVTKFVVHDLRHGALADLAHADQNKIRGHASMAAAAAVGHKMTVFMKDVTERYVGGSDVATWNMRAASNWTDSRAPKLAQVPYIPRAFAKDELKNYCESRGWDPTNKTKLCRAGTVLRKADKDKWRAMWGNNSVSMETRTQGGQERLGEFFPDLPHS
jgi:hypothetical protein